MDTLTREVEPGVESQLVDLSDVPLAVLRELDGPAMRRSLVHVVEQARYTRVSADGGGGGGGGNAERID